MATTFDGRQIMFDPHDWTGIANLCRRHEEFDVPWAGTNEDGEHVAISVNRDNITVETFQSNDWLRTNVYYPEDRCVEETYDK